MIFNLGEVEFMHKNFISNFLLVVFLFVSVNVMGQETDEVKNIPITTA